MSQIIKMNRKIRIEELPEKERKIILAIVRTYIRTTGMAQETGLGLEKCEETVIAMLNARKLIIVYDEEKDLINIKRTKK